MAKSGMKMTGDWGKVMNLSVNMHRIIDRSLQTTLAQLGLRAEMMAVKFMAEQSLKWAPLSQKYLDYKSRKGLSTKILIASSTYFQSITSQTKGNVSFAGVLRKARGDDGEDLADIAQVHEYGSIGRNIPPRRLWFNVMIEMRKFLVKERIFERNVIRDLKHGRNS